MLFPTTTRFVPTEQKVPVVIAIVDSERRRKGRRDWKNNYIRGEMDIKLLFTSNLSLTLITAVSLGH